MSPLVPSTYLLVALAGIEFGDHQRFTLKWAVLVCLCIMVAALLMGIFRCSALYKSNIRGVAALVNPKRGAA